jgi:hypothetical protein
MRYSASSAFEAVSDEMRALIEELWPVLVHKLPPKDS